jgi:hypothetical protein
LWCGIRTNYILKYFVNPKGLSYEDLLDGVVPKLASWLTVRD